MTHVIKAFVADGSGMTRFDYSLIWALICVAAIVPLSALDMSLSAFFRSASGEIYSVIATAFGS